MSKYHQDSASLSASDAKGEPPAFLKKKKDAKDAKAMKGKDAFPPKKSFKGAAPPFKKGSARGR